MTNISVIRKNNKVIVEITGHANYSESGKDIVCAGVSILSYTLLNAISEEEELLNCDILVKETNEKKGYFYLEFNYYSHASERIEVILNTIELGYLSLQQCYPGYVDTNIDEKSYIN